MFATKLRWCHGNSKAWQMSDCAWQVLTIINVFLFAFNCHSIIKIISLRDEFSMYMGEIGKFANAQEKYNRQLNGHMETLHENQLVIASKTGIEIAEIDD